MDTKKYFEALSRMLGKNEIQTAPPERNTLPILLGTHSGCLPNSTEPSSLVGKPSMAISLSHGSATMMEPGLCGGTIITSSYAI